MRSVDIVEFSAGPGLAPSIRAQTAVDPWHHTQHHRVAGAALVCLNVRLGYTFFEAVFSSLVWTTMSELAYGRYW
jgi:hypothetical protein